MYIISSSSLSYFTFKITVPAALLLLVSIWFMYAINNARFIIFHYYIGCDKKVQQKREKNQTLILINYEVEFAN